MPKRRSIWFSVDLTWRVCLFFICFHSTDSPVPTRTFIWFYLTCFLFRFFRQNLRLQYANCCSSWSRTQSRCRCVDRHRCSTAGRWTNNTQSFQAASTSDWDEHSQRERFQRSCGVLSKIVIDNSRWGKSDSSSRFWGPSNYCWGISATGRNRLEARWSFLVATFGRYFLSCGEEAGHR